MNTKEKKPTRWGLVIVLSLFGVLLISTAVGTGSASRSVPESLQAPTEAEIRAQVEAAAAFAKTPAGQLCAKHPAWSDQDCKWLIEDRYWIGMTYDMLEYERGKPSSVRPSNYGNGARYQYCWSQYVPSCFYDNNADNKMDSYN